jgi:NTE family protein
VTTLATLPRPVAFVFSGGASLGSLQVGMLQALATTGLRPDLVVGTSVGALNGAVLAEQGDVAAAADLLETTWRNLQTTDVMPGRRAGQALRLLRSGSLVSDDGLRALIETVLVARRLEDLRLPFAAVAVAVRTGHATLIREGDLVSALLSSGALPGAWPPVTHEGEVLVDGGLVANVPMVQAVSLGAGSLVVLDAGDICHLDVAPRPFPEGLFLAMNIATRQRALLEAPLIARTLPVVYLPRPCVRNRSPFDLSTSGELIDPARILASRFLDSVAPPDGPGMVGGPHQHDGEPWQPPAVDLLIDDKPPAAPA